jgi:heme exporter protein A
MQVQLGANNLACERGVRLLFAGLSLSLGPGEALHVTGPNGIGKSSLLRQLAGLLPAYIGAVSRQGSLALLDERLALDEHSSLGDALRFWEKLDGSENPDSTYERMQISALLDIPVRFLSTGQRKRAGLARLINSGSDIWLLDEPLNGLDSDASKVLEQEIARHCGQGGICLVASHQGIVLPGANTLALSGFAPDQADETGAQGL